MKRVILMNLFLLVLVATLSAQVKLEHYGFLKGDMVYTTKGVKSFNAENLTAAQVASGVDNPALGFTAQHSRFGLKGSAGDAIKVGGTLELDFFWAGFDANARSRVRLAYASMAKGNMELRFGQQWDLFSPNIPMTNNTNGILWFSGNYGFRRAQFQFHYKMPMENMTPMLQLSIGEATREESGLGSDNKAAFPMIQGRLSSKFINKHTLGVYFVYAKYDPNPNSDNDEFNTSGFGLDFDFPFSTMLALKGEINMGTNLNNANLFTPAGNGAAKDDRKSMGFWINAISKPSTSVNFVLGFGSDKNQTDNLANGATESNSTIYGDIIFPFGNGFSIALEAQHISTKIKGGDTNSALVLDIAGILNF
ncbi:MAG: hypothetical protein ONB31_12675 [candidate division KSB1 bacterium]|nr:hypothetical protein [candidate division KSB1 bacterium]MDZ7401859.1 hypothetical protein [candidate division KSB1 bacterium]